MVDLEKNQKLLFEATQSEHEACLQSEEENICYTLAG